MIEVKEKPCRGTGKAKGYGCGRLTKYRTYGLGKMCCYPKWLLETPQGKLKLEKATLKASKPRKEFNEYKKQRNDRNKITTLMKAVKDVCHRYIRLRDKGKPCISCGTPWHDEFEAGHYYKAELFSTLKYNEDNIHGQCIRCNRPLEGNLSEYSVGLITRIGSERMKVLNELSSQEKKKNHKWEREELKKIREYYKLKIKELETNK